jgi:hypothetical protein
MRKLILLASIACFGFTSPVIAQNKPAPAPTKVAVLGRNAPVPQVPPPEAMIVLIRSTVVALGHANMTNNYSVLNSLGSDTFRAANNPARLGQIFTSFRANNIDLNPVVYLTPQLTKAPAMEGGRLHLVGFFPSQPMQVNFDLMFEPSQGTWKLFGLGVNLSAVKQQQALQQAPQQGR